LSIRSKLRAAIIFLLPGKSAAWAANRLGYKFGAGSRIGFSWLDVDSIVAGQNVVIGHFNQLRGPFSVKMADYSKIGHNNVISRGPIGVTVGASELSMGIWSAITARHRLDMCCSVTLGDYSTIAGLSTQIWTHGYIHAQKGLDRYRIDAPVIIGDNVSIGSMCLLTMGVSIASGVTVGGGTSVSKDLDEPGLYVSAPIRKLALPSDPDTRSDLELIDTALSQDKVYRKRIVK
jgi:acetyltransferase-like isoleucine patch superfamily enzyme